MGIRFRKYLTFGKLLRLNISKSGISTTIGVKGASVNIGKSGVYLNTGIPGTGIYSREKLSNNQKEKGKIHSQEAIIKAQNALDEYDREQKRIEVENRKSDIAPQINKADLDDFFLDIAYYVVSEDIVSPYRIKSKFGIDYTRTERIMQQLEDNKIVSPCGITGRKVLISLNAYNNMIG